MSLLNSHWFDLVAVVVLIVGFKTGQHKEALPKLLSAIRWALTLLICLFLYKLPALWLAKKFSMQPDTVALMLFPLEFLIVFFLVGIVWKRVTNIYSDKEPFGKWEHHMTKVAGSLRFLVFLLVAMAWISGRYVTEKDIRDHKTFCKENFGGITYPVLSTINNDMFNGSYTGKFAKDYLGGILMTPLPRVDYGEKPLVAGNPKLRKAQLRELDTNFQMEDKKTGEGKVKEKGEQESATGDPTNGTPSGQIVYHDITLKGISGTGDRLFALINDQTFSAGELSSVRFQDRKIVVQCLQILQRSVKVHLDGKPEMVELQLGVATGLDGKPLVKSE